MIKRFTAILFMILTGFISCYDALDTYENGRTYNLRDRGPAGGWIFYINPNYKTDGWRYLEAASEDLNGGVQFQWDSNNSTIPAAQGVVIGTGRVNTAAITSADSAAQKCRDYRGGGYSDWFLPSRSELVQMCWVLHSRKWNGSTGEDNPAYGSNRVGGFTNFTYWSSTENSSNTAHAITLLFGNGDSNSFEKNSSTLLARAIRAF